MTAYLELEGRLERPWVPTHAEPQEASLWVAVRPTEALRALPVGAQADIHVCLLLDVSQSMEDEGKLGAAIAAARELIELVGPGARISLVAFDEEAHVLAQGLEASKREALLERLEGLRTVGGGMTNITAGLAAALRLLEQDDPSQGRARAIVLLSDGEDNTCKPDVIHAAVQAADANVQLFAVGMGRQYEADFLKALVTPSNGSLFGHAEVQRVKEAFIDLAVTLANVAATQVSLELGFGEGVLVGKAYKASPDQLYLGSAALGPERRLMRRVGGVERNREYAFLFRVRLPAGPAGRVAVARARLTYDVPALGLRGAVVEAQWWAERTSERALWERQDGVVLECTRRVQLTELVERFVEAHRAGLAEDTARYLEVLVRKYQEMNDRKMVNHYEGIRAELLRGGQITRAMLNASVVASTVVRGRGELPALVDDSF
jgi:hypothetical protein